MMSEANSSVRAISECFIKPEIADDDSKKRFYLGAFEMIQMSQFYLQKGILFRKGKHTNDNSSNNENNNNDNDNSKNNVNSNNMDSSNNNDNSNNDIKSEYLVKLKNSLKTTLAHFYPLAGQFVTVVEEDEHKSYIYIDCNKGPGAKFIHAAIDVKVDDLASQSYVPTIAQSFFDLGRIPRNYDAHNEPMLVVQVTELVDGVFLGVSMNHSVVDGTSLWHFLSSWSEIFRSENELTPISRPPVCQRWFPEGHGPILRIPYTNPDEFIEKYNGERNDTLREVIFQLSSESIATLKEKANVECEMVNKISSFQALSAAIWRFIVRARQHPRDKDSLCIIVANARPIMVPPLSQDYFGSFAVATFNYIKASELVKNSLGKVALSVNQKVEEVTFEHLQNVFVGWIKSPYFAGIGAICPNTIVISGTPREDSGNVEFGFGKAVVTRTGSNKYDGKVVLHPGKEGKGSVSIQICLSPDAMNALQNDQEFASLLS